MELALTYTSATMEFSRIPTLLLALLCASLADPALAEIYKSIDADGHVTYSSTPSRGAKRLWVGPLGPSSGDEALPAASDSSSASSRKASSRRSSPADFPKVDRYTQKNRDSMRRKILEDELNSEQKLLAESNASLQQERMARNDQKIGQFKEEITLHEKNISALKTELANIK